MTPAAGPRPGVPRRPATRDDAAAMARLHRNGITEGFLPTLGQPFLAMLYRRVVTSPVSFAVVAERGGVVVGFVAGTESVPRLYRDFLVRDGARAVVVAAPRLVPAGRRAWETFRHGRSDALPGLPPAELLALAVAPAARRSGLGRALVEAFTAELGRRAVEAARVVVGPGNAAALALYQSCGFRPVGQRQVHRGTTSTVLVWP